MDGTTFDGYYYFDETGRMVTEPGTHELEMTSNGQMFSGTYYFGGANGALEQKAGTTPDGFPVDETGKVQGLDVLGIENLEPQLESAISGYDGNWSVYVKDLETEEEFVINDEPMYSASLIKAFVMAKTFEDMDLVLENEAKQMKTDAANAAVQTKIDNLLTNMITVSDNDAANTLVSYLGSGDSSAGMSVVNDFCSQEGYSSTHMGRLLLASNQYDDNYTSVSDCGHFLKKVYKGNQESDAHAQAEFALLAAQTRRNKIPAQMPSGVSVANKTGELSDVENDAGIIYNSQNDLIIVFMSENVPQPGSAQSTIASLSRQIYDSYNS